MVTLTLLKFQNFLSTSYVVGEHVQNFSSEKTQNQKSRSLGSRLNLDPTQQDGLRLVPLCPWFMVSSSINEGFSLFKLLSTGKPKASQLGYPLEIQFTGLWELFMRVEQVSVESFQYCYSKFFWSLYSCSVLCPPRLKCAVESRLILTI